MFKIDGQILAYLNELKDSFQLEKVLPIITDVISTDELFLGEDRGEEFRNALRFVYNSTDKIYNVEVNEGGRVGVIIDKIIFPINMTPRKEFMKATALNRKDTLSLLLCEMVGRPFEIQEGNKDDSLYGEINAQEIKCFTTANSNSDHNGKLALNEIHNISEKDAAMVVLRCDNDSTLDYLLEARNRMFILSLNNRPINKIPQLSISSSHVNYLQYEGDSDVWVCGFDFRTNSQCGKYKFDADGLSQVCADDKSGFIVLINGEILSFSDEVQPDDIEDLNDFVTQDEKIVMITLINRQIFALTDAKNVYSNYTVKVPRQGHIIWIKKDGKGKIQFIYDDEIPLPISSDTEVLGAKSITYNNGKISK